VKARTTSDRIVTARRSIERREWKRQTASSYRLSRGVLLEDMRNLSRPPAVPSRLFSNQRDHIHRTITIPPSRDRGFSARVEATIEMRLSVLLATVALAVAGTPSHATAASADALGARVTAELRSFTKWLRQGGAHGFIGEVGWPANTAAGGDARWNDIARTWYEQAGKEDLHVAAWAAGEFWSPAYKLLLYAYEPGSGAPGVANPQAAVIEAQASSARRGVNLAGPEFAAPVDEPESAFSNVARGTHGVQYQYASSETFRYLAGRGIAFVRLPVRWERLQPVLGGPLDPAELGLLSAAVAAARDVGIDVILDVHNYGAYYLYDPGRGRGVRRPIGSAAVTTGHFADLWRRLSLHFAAEPGVTGYGLMNEPVGMNGAGAWETASRAAVAAIRRTGDQTRIFVQSYFWGGVTQFAQYHRGGPWISDANTWYEAHQYFDADRSARYLASFDEEVARARALGFGRRQTSEPARGLTLRQPGAGSNPRGSAGAR
jgi:aryl-phospho-beta-D-glucosidase BglC (GH1 family)